MSAGNEVSRFKVDPGAHSKALAMKIYYMLISCILCVTGFAKLVSSFGTAKILLRPDPILGLSYRTLFLSIGTLEIALAIIVLLSKSHLLRGLLVFWLGAMFLTYRAGIYLLKLPHECPCLGTLAERLHLSDSAAQLLLRTIALFFFVSGFLVVFSEMRGKRALDLAARNEVCS